MTWNEVRSLMELVNNDSKQRRNQVNIWFQKWILEVHTSQKFKYLASDLGWKTNTEIRTRIWIANTLRNKENIAKLLYNINLPNSGQFPLWWREAWMKQISDSLDVNNVCVYFLDVFPGRISWAYFLGVFLGVYSRCIF